MHPAAQDNAEKSLNFSVLAHDTSSSLQKNIHIKNALMPKLYALQWQLPETEAVALLTGTEITQLKWENIKWYNTLTMGTIRYNNQHILLDYLYFF